MFECEDLQPTKTLSSERKALLLCLFSTGHLSVCIWSDTLCISWRITYWIKSYCIQCSSDWCRAEIKFPTHKIHPIFNAPIASFSGGGGSGVGGILWVSCRKLPIFWWHRVINIFLFYVMHNTNVSDAPIQFTVVRYIRCLSISPIVSKQLGIIITCSVTCEIDT